MIDSHRALHARMTESPMDIVGGNRRITMAKGKKNKKGKKDKKKKDMMAKAKSAKKASKKSAKKATHPGSRSFRRR